MFVLTDEVQYVGDDGEESGEGPHMSGQEDWESALVIGCDLSRIMSLQLNLHVTCLEKLRRDFENPEIELHKKPIGNGARLNNDRVLFDKSSVHPFTDTWI